MLQGSKVREIVFAECKTLQEGTVSQSVDGKDVVVGKIYNFELFQTR
jgi:hypothetical protein